MIYVFDTNVLSAYAEPPTSPKAKSDNERAVWTVERLRSVKAKLFIPTPVLMEYLIIKEPEMHGRHAAILNKVFNFASLDVPSAELAASYLRKYHQDRHQRKKSKTARPGDADKYNSIHGIDAQIMAIAKSLKAAGIYSFDSDIEDFSKYSKVPVLKLDTTREELFTTEN